MLFVLLFVVGMLVVPFLIDAHQHGGRNILKRSGSEIVAFTGVQGAYRSLGRSVSRVNSAVVSVFALAVLFAAVFLLLWIVFKLLSLILHLVFGS